jgi:omega-amidase
LTGSYPERDGDKVYNTCVSFGPSGDIMAKYRKMHLFDIDVPGGITFKESDTLSAGNELAILGGICVFSRVMVSGYQLVYVPLYRGIDTVYGKIGLGICYDLRFAHLSLLYAAKGCSMLVFPGAFNTTTGPLHWELLIRARALDSQVFVAACSPARNLGPGYPAWGHSTVVNPWGEVIATTSHHPTTVFADIDLGIVDSTRWVTGVGSACGTSHLLILSAFVSFRAQIPVTSQRRTDLYSLGWNKDPKSE